MTSDNDEVILKTSQALPPAWDRVHRRTDQVHPLRVTLSEIILSANNIKDFESKKLCCEVRLTLFDITYKQFFGKTWISPITECRFSQECTIALEKNIYFHTSFADQNIVLAVEVIINDSSDSHQRAVSGWSFIRLFSAEDDVKDVGSIEPSQSYKIDLYYGSPRALLFLEEPIESNRYMQKILGCSMKYFLKTHGEMLNVIHLIPENVLIGALEYIPGLQKDTKYNDYLRKIKIDKGISVSLDKVFLTLDNLEKFEDELCHLLNEDRLNREHMSPDGSELNVFERRLQIGIHNGWSYIQEPQIHHLVPDSVVSNNVVMRPVLKPEHHRSSSIVSRGSSYSSSLVLRNKVELTDVPVNCFIIFLLEYILSFPMPAIDRRPSSSASIGRGSTLSVTVAWCSWSVPNKLNGSEINLALHGGPCYNVDSQLLFRSSREEGNYSMRINFLFSTEENASRERHTSFDNDAEDSPLTEKPLIETKGPALTKHLSRYSDIKSPKKKPSISSPSNARLNDNYHEQMPEVPFHPAPHLPIIPSLGSKEILVGPKALSRAGYASLYSTAYPAILDRHGKSPETIDFYGNAKISLETETLDPMKCNEIGIEFLALSGSQSLMRGQLVYFIFQFYRYPPVKTERFLLENYSSNAADNFSYPLILYKAKNDETKMELADPGFRMKFNVDTEFLFDDGENKEFMKYLFLKKLFVDVWDAQSMNLIGTVSIPLKCLCRQGKSAIQTICEVDVVPNEYKCNEDSNPVNHSNCLLHVRMSNIGRPIDPELLKQRQFKLKQKHDSNHILLTQPLIEEDRQLVELLKSYSFRNVNCTNSEEKKRKLNRMNAVRSKLGLEQPVLSFEGPTNKLEMLEIIDEYRNKHKDEIIRNNLFKSITSSYSLYPTLGNAEVFLHSIVNSSDQPETVIIENCPNLNVISTYSEWIFFKEHFGFTINLEEDMFSQEGDQIKLYLRPKEKIIIPFKYQKLFFDEELLGHVNDAPFALISKENSLKINIKNCINGKYLCIMNVRINPQPVTSDEVLVFYHPENSFFKTFIQVPIEFKGKLSARSSDGNNICGIENSESGGCKNIYLKVQSGAASSFKTFFIFLYNDRFSSIVIYTWKITIYFEQKIDICCMQGQTSRTSLILRGQAFTRTVKVCSSDDNLLALEPAHPIILPAGSLQEIHVGIRVMQAGSRYFKINVVDVDNLLLFKSWLVFVRTENQTITKAFQVNLDAGNSKSAKKRIKFTNPYPVKKEFTIQTNCSSMLQIKERKFELEGGESYPLSLYFLPCQKKGATEVLVFINNSKDENEETYCIRTVVS